MATDKLNKVLARHVAELETKGTAKGSEMVVSAIIPASENKGPRYVIEGMDGKKFIRMNSNSYLGMSMRKDVIEAEEKAAAEFGVGPGAVRFISGTYKLHKDLEEKIAKFHNREDAIILSSAYVSSMGVIVPLCTDETVIISDELNHNCIINGMRLARPSGKFIYKHNDMNDLREKLTQAVGKGKRALVITDGIFSMRGDLCPFDKFVPICSEFEDKFEEGVITIADDSHGVGAFGTTGRGTEEYTGAKVDILIGTLGKAFGVNGGYVVADKEVIRFMRESTPMYIYSNPITCSEAAAVMKVLDIIDTDEGRDVLVHLKKMTEKFEKGVTDLGYETIEGPHPVVPLMLRDTETTRDCVSFLKENGVLATGLNFPVVPKGDEEIRFQVNGDHSEYDIDCVLDILKKFKESR